MSTFRKVSGLDAPGNATRLIGLMVVIAVLAVIGYGGRIFRRATAEQRLPVGHVAAAWVHSALLIALYAYLGSVLAGDVEEFVFGVPDRVVVNVWLLILNTMLGLVIAGFAVLHWAQNAGTLRMRITYSFVAAAALINLWVASAFNILSFPFSHLS